MKISIIIPVYNVDRYIRRCIDSVIAQTWRGDMECILVDDATPDNSMATARECLKGYNGGIEFRIVVHKENRGLSAARNTGARNASGDYLYFLDSDDAITPDCIETLADIALAHPAVDVVQGNLVVTDEIYRLLDSSLYDFPEYCDDREWISEHIKSDIPVTAWNKLFRRDFFVGLNLWFKEGILHEDEHWRYIHGDKISSIAFSGKPTYIYYRNPGSIMDARAKDRSFSSMMEILNEYLPSITRKEHYAPVILYVYSLTKRLHELNDPQSFMEQYNAFVNRMIASPAIPASVKASCRYMRRHSLWLEIVCAMFLRRSHRIIKRMKAMDKASTGKKPTQQS